MNNGKRKFADGKFAKSIIVVAGIVLGQAVLYGPSLIGQKILLPLDILAYPNVYLPQTPATAGIVPHNIVLSDLVYQFEPDRHYANSELCHGRFPLWAPYQYGGVPFVWPKFSPFLFLESCIRSPVILAWTQLLAALVAGTGMFFFCRKSLSVGFWPATVCAWCYPLTAFFVLWQGYPTGLAVYWLPWLLLSVAKTVRGESCWAPLGLSVVTCLVLVSGHIDMAGQTLLGAGIYALWCWWQDYPGKWFCRKARMAIMTLVVGWGLGFLLAAPHLLPLLEYAKTGSRMNQRSAGIEERRPVGLAALPQVILPDIYGDTQKDSLFIAPNHEGNLLESASAAYTGVVATLLVAPLAWCSRRHRALNLFWIGFAFFGLSWCLDVPGLVTLLRLPGLNMMSHNRLVFLTSFAILSLTAIGLETILNGSLQRRWWFWLPAALLAGLAAWCYYRSAVLPYPVSSQMNYDAYRANTFNPFMATRNVHPLQAWFILHFTVMANLCLFGFICWLAVWFRGVKRFLFPLLAIFLVGDLLWFGYGRSPQCDPALYFPDIPALQQVAQAAPGRVIGANCLAASLAVMQGLSDVRGYDSIDPAHMVDLLKTAARPGGQRNYAAVQHLAPRGGILPSGMVQLMPIMDMLDVRYVIFRGTPPPDIHPAFQSTDYWVLENSNALPRVFVPQSVETVSNGHDELAILASPHFNPAQTAYVEVPVELPAPCRGTVQITNEIPTCIRVSVHMETPGLVVLADNWDKGWRAFWNGNPVPMLRTDYAIRGVVVPAGNGTLEFVYQPTSLVTGLWLAGLAFIALLCWMATIKFQLLETKSASSLANEIASP
jgi:hypothetical protein